MKKILFVGAFGLLGAVLVNAQQNSVKVNPFALLGGADLITYERAIGGPSTIGLSAGFGGFKVNGIKYKTAGVSAFYRYYLHSTALRGWYGHGGLSYNLGEVIDNYTYATRNDSSKYSSLGGNVKAGYQWIWNSGLTLDLNGGIQYLGFFYSDDNQVNASGLLPAFGLALGYSF